MQQPTGKTSQKVKPRNGSKRVSTARLFWLSFKFQLREFFQNSTLHGVRYIAEEGRPVGERFMWLCFTLSGAVATFIIIANLWEKFQTNPTITGLDTDSHNQEITFPTVNVCPTDPYDVNRTRELAMSMASHDLDSADRIEAILQSLTRLSYDLFDELAHTPLTNMEIKIYLKKPLRTYAFQTKVECDEVFDVCRYKNEEMDCCKIFAPVYTEHGMCYSFNGRFTDTPNEEIKNEKFHNMFVSDKKWSLHFEPKIQSHIFVHSHKENFGYDFRPQIVWKPPFATELLISMKETYTTEDARQLSIMQRKCIFPDELQLSIYDDDEYAFTSCMKECRVKKCVSLCECVPPFYRPLDVAPYCGFSDFVCLAKNMKNITNVRDCKHCELSCSNTVYDIEKLSENNGEQNTAGGIIVEENYVNIEYLTWPIIRYKREVLFGWVDLLVSFGGIAGLFLGFSLLSGVEIVYYFTMRAFCMVYKNQDILLAANREASVNNGKAVDRDVIQVIPMRHVAQTSADLILAKRFNRTDVKYMNARENARARFERNNKVGYNAQRAARVAFLETGQFGYIP